MKKLIQKYNEIKTKISAKLNNALVLSKQKINNFIDIDNRDNFKNTLSLVTFVFLISFSLLFVVSVNRINKELVSTNIIKIKSNVNVELNKKIKELTAGYPIENMSRYIAREDTEVAAFIVSIAKKESNWGKRTPKLNGEECYNYWGFRKKRERMGSGGHTCFDNPKDAVKSIADRIKDLIEKDIDTPEKMVVWKCGYSCKSHNPKSVQKWINDVKLYYNKI